MVSNNVIGKGDDDLVRGIDNEIKSNLVPQIAFKSLMERGILSENDVERIIERASYAEDKSRVRRYLDAEFPGISEEDKKYILSIRVKDFGRLSRKFLTELEGCDKTGEVMTIMGALWNTQDNLMEILSGKYTFRDEIEKFTIEYYDGHGDEKTLSKKLERMYIPNAVKRPIYRTLAVLKDIEKAFGKPEKIFVETTRSHDATKKGKRTSTRKEQILALYDKCGEDAQILREQLEAMGEYADQRLQSDKLFLYYTQMGKCMYTGKSISLESLMTGSAEYNIEHIYPQSKVKDDSIVNNLVLVYSEENGLKNDTYPIESRIRNSQAENWRYLKKVGAISEEKYNRLTRNTPFSEEEKYGFINRQIVETSQATKAVAALLQDRLPETEIVTCKAGLVSDFRHEYDILKVRSYNDHHHAVDAYLNIVVGNVYHMKFTRNWFSVNKNYSVKTKTVFEASVVIGEKTIWGGEEMLKQVKKTALRNDGHFTKYSFFKTGGLFEQQPESAKEGLVPRKKDLPTEIYGGYNSASVMLYHPVQYFVKGKKDIMLMPVELSIGRKFLEDDDFRVKYTKERLESILGKEVSDITYPMGVRPLKVNTVLSLDGFRVCISGTSSKGRSLLAQPIMQLKAEDKWQLYIKKLERFQEKVKKYAKKSSDNKSVTTYMYDKEYDKISVEENIQLYDIFTDKLKNSIYHMRPANPVGILEDGREEFLSLDIYKQTECLLSILMVFGRNAGGCDLQNIGGGKRAAASTISSTLNNLKKHYRSIYIIDSSTTGIWEKKSCNLLDLL